MSDSRLVHGWCVRVPVEFSLMKMSMMKQFGFTLIELIIVIVILGILAAFAVPRFVDLAQSARIAAVRGLEGSVRAAAALAHAKQLADNGGINDSVNMDGTTVTMSNRYPTDNSAGIAAALQSTSGFTLSGSAPILFQKDGAQTPSSCQVSYTAAASVGAAPTITSTTSGCG